MLAPEFAVELLLWVTAPESPEPLTGALTFDWTPGAEIAVELASWSTLFVAFSV